MHKGRERRVRRDVGVTCPVRVLNAVEYNMYKQVARKLAKDRNFTTLAPMSTI